MAVPTFQVHRIRRVTDGKALACFQFWRPKGKENYFTNEGVFFRKMETIRKHLKKLTEREGYDPATLYVESFEVLSSTRTTNTASDVLALNKKV